jgi:glyoxylase-like metal-dependent hydrolase (beta-lactamase superfamily II)
VILRPFLHAETACASYLFGCLSGSKLAVVDPHYALVDEYLAEAERAGAPIVAVFETHVQADHVSGLPALVEATGATPYLPPGAGVEFPHEELADGQLVELGNTRVRALATPGHAPAHHAYVVADLRRGTDEPWLVFTGDSLLVGDVGRPDLHANGDAAELARAMRSSIDRLLELPGRIGAERRRRTALVLDEFQEVVRLDETLPNRMRAVFQTQPEVCHAYLGSKRHVLDALFNDRNEPFWRSARQMTIGRLPRNALETFVRDRFAVSEREIDDDAVARLLELAEGHPYGTQELAFFTWARVPHGHAAHAADVEAALSDVLRAEHNNLSRVWEGATQNERLVLLALRSGPASLYAEETRLSAGLPAATFVQRAVSALVREDVVELALRVNTPTPASASLS